MEIFDEDKATEYILDKLKSRTPDGKTPYKADDILEIIDIIWDYYEDNGLLDLDMSDANDVEEDNVDKQKLIDHVAKMISKDKGSRINLDDIPAIVEAELEYEAQCDEI